MAFEQMLIQGLSAQFGKNPSEVADVYELIELLQHQMDFLQGKLEEALTSVRSLTSANDRQPP